MFKDENAKAKKTVAYHRVFNVKEKILHKKSCGTL